MLLLSCSWRLTRKGVDRDGIDMQQRAAGRLRPLQRTDGLNTWGAHYNSWETGAPQVKIFNVQTDKIYWFIKWGSGVVITPSNTQAHRFIAVVIVSVMLKGNHQNSVKAASSSFTWSLMSSVCSAIKGFMGKLCGQFAQTKLIPVQFPLLLLYKLFINLEMTTSRATQCLQSKLCHIGLVNIVYGGWFR